jgi:replicative DNA helicase
LCTSYAKADKLEYQAGRMTPQQYERFVERAGQITEWDLTIDDTARSVAQIETVTRRMYRQSPLDLIIVDPLGLVEAPRAENTNIEIGKTLAKFKLLSRDIAAPILIVHHVSDKKIDERSDKRPKASDGYGSGYINQSADIILSTYREDFYDPDTDAKNIFEIAVLKNRSGSTAGMRVQLICDRYGNMLDAAVQEEPPPIWRGG